ncbi:alanine racemase [Paenibacillus hemerocallicola]|nr:alanine racemase [Paenibacillus hemerocallicola]
MMSAVSASCVHYTAEPSTWSEIRLDRLKDNIREIRHRIPAGCAFMAVLKADGYGHGLLQTARAALAGGADAVAVGTLREALLLRKGSIGGPILALTPCDPSEADIAAENGISLPVFQEEWFKEMRRCKTTRKRLRVHLKIDTGMGRFGVRDENELERIIPLLRANDIVVEGVYTHLATANQADESFVREQLRRFREMHRRLREAGFVHPIAHCANSAAALRFPELALDMVRVGASLFGIVPVDGDAAKTIDIRLMQTFSVHSRIVHVKRLRKGESVGYDKTYTAPEDEWIATLPIGYADGLSRACKGMSLLVDGQWAPIAGNVCMNQVMVRLPAYYPNGTRVTLLGENGGQTISLERMAEAIGTIPQEVLTLLGARIPRVYTE